MNQGPPEVSRIERTLELARAAVNQQNPDRAIALVGTLSLQGGEEGFERHWAESRLVLAEAYAAKGDFAAESLFEEALELIRVLPQPEESLEVRAHEHFGDYLRCFAKRPSLARQNYEIAKKKAIGLRTQEDSARLQLKIEMIDLTMDESPELENFKTLKRVGKEAGCTSAEQLAVWLQHKGEIGQHDQGLRFARNRDVAGEQYFKYLLGLIRKSS
jgi:hypothetical protein